MFKGRILKPDQTAESLKLEEGLTIHLVRKPAPKTSKPAATSGQVPSAASTPSSNIGEAASGASTTTPPNPFAGLGGMGGSLPGMSSGGGLSGMGGMNIDPNTIQSMMGNPMFSSMMDQMLSNPEMMNSMIENNPSLRAMAEQNPQVRDMLQNPEMMRSMMTPEALQASMNLMNNANSNSMFGTMSGADGSMPAPGGASGSSTGAASTGAAATGSSTSGATGVAGATGASTTGKNNESTKLHKSVFNAY